MEEDQEVSGNQTNTTADEWEYEENPEEVLEDHVEVKAKIEDLEKEGCNFYL